MNLKYYPDPCLRLKSETVNLLDEVEHILHLETKMKEVLQKEKGLGLSAIQLGVPKRMFVMKNIMGNIITIINPIILGQQNKEVVKGEGCLSIPGRQFRTKRYNSIQVKYTNLLGQEVKENFIGLESIIFQHEFDHLNGTLVLDRRI